MPFANWIARRLWFYALWFMRRPWIKRMRRNAPNLLPEHKRAAAWERIKAQDRWAMRHGVTILRVAINVLLASLFMNALYFGFLYLQESGAFRSGPQKVP